MDIFVEEKWIFFKIHSMISKKSRGQFKKKTLWSFLRRSYGQVYFQIFCKCSCENCKFATKMSFLAKEKLNTCSKWCSHGITWTVPLPKRMLRFAQFSSRDRAVASSMSEIFLYSFGKYIAAIGANAFCQVDFFSSRLRECSTLTKCISNWPSGMGWNMAKMQAKT